MRIDGASQGSGELRRVVALNEEIKAVVEVSRGLGLEAINAMLVSRRAGDSVKGFAVVSTELRSFSHRLATLMDGLAGDLAALVHGVADVSRRAYVRGHLAATDGAGRHGSELGAAVSRIDLAMATTAMANGHAWSQVRRTLLRSLKLCDNGRALARGARIEAVYGGAMSADLAQAGQAIERTIERIRERLLAGVEIAGARP